MKFISLKDKKIIDRIFSKEAKSIYLKELKVRYISIDSNTTFLICISNSLFKKAVDRNLLKRRIKAIITEIDNTKFNKKFDNKAIALIFNTKELLEYSLLKEKITNLLSIA